MMTAKERMLVKALRVALMEFDRISYQMKADPSVLQIMRKAIYVAEVGGGPERTRISDLLGVNEAL